MEGVTCPEITNQKARGAGSMKIADTEAGNGICSAYRMSPSKSHMNTGYILSAARVWSRQLTMSRYPTGRVCKWHSKTERRGNSRSDRSRTLHMGILLRPQIKSVHCDGQSNGGRKWSVFVNVNADDDGGDPRRDPGANDFGFGRPRLAAARATTTA